jgi:diacylglycerol kinase (ATP)
MQNNKKLKLLFIVNPVAGGKGKQDWEASIREYFKNQPHSIEFYILTGASDTTSIRNYISTLNIDRVVAVGGDGTVKLVAGVLKETPIPLGILPAGSANGMAKELDIPLDINEALKIITEGTIKKIDLIKINEEELCIHLGDIGMNATIVKQFETYKKRGMWGYAKALIKVLFLKKKFRSTVITDSKTVKRHAYMIVIANAKKYGMGAVINPKGKLGDSFFEVVIVRKLNLFAVLNGIFKGESFNPRKVEVIQTRNLELHTQQKVHFQIDGEYLGKTASVKARILPQILNIIIPGPNTP